MCDLLPFQRLRDVCAWEEEEKRTNQVLWLTYEPVRHVCVSRQEEKRGKGGAGRAQTVEGAGRALSPVNESAGKAKRTRKKKERMGGAGTEERRRREEGSSICLNKI